MKRAGVRVRGYEALDLVTEIDEPALSRAIADWDKFANNGPYRHRLEVLAGPELIDLCLERARTPPRGRGASSSPSTGTWRNAATWAAFNTPGSEARMLQAAIEADNQSEAETYVGAAITRAQLTTLTDEPFDPPVDALVALIGRRSYLGERAADLALAIAAPLPERVAEALSEAAGAGGEHATMAMYALTKAAPSPTVRRAVESALESSDANLQAAALGVFAEHWGEEARPMWRAFLASRSAPLRQAAESVIGEHGSVEDLPEAAGHLAKLARTKSAIHMSPPRGSEIVDLLVRHAEEPVARRGLDDLSARWDRLGDDLREWLEAHHPSLNPSRRVDAPTEQPAEAEERLEWPPPTIKRKGKELLLQFEDTDMFETRERFEELALAHPRIHVIDGDREWTSMTIDGDDPEALIRELWTAAGRPPA